MNHFISVNFDTQMVSARELHKALGIEKRFSVWFEMNAQGFVEGEDFTGVYLQVQSNQYGERKESEAREKKKRTTGEQREIIKSSSIIWIQLPEFDPYRELNHCIGMYKAAV